MTGLDGRGAQHARKLMARRRAIAGIGRPSASALEIEGALEGFSETRAAPRARSAPRARAAPPRSRSRADDDDDDDDDEDDDDAEYDDDEEEDDDDDDDDDEVAPEPPATGLKSDEVGGRFNYVLADGPEESEDDAAAFVDAPSLASEPVASSPTLDAAAFEAPSETPLVPGLDRTWCTALVSDDYVNYARYFLREFGVEQAANFDDVHVRAAAREIKGAFELFFVRRVERARGDGCHAESP